MNDRPNLNEEALVTIAEYSSESLASILVHVLKDEGIKAVATGGFTAGFRAEAPGFVSVKTLQSDADRARAIAAEVDAQAVIDGDAVATEGDVPEA